MAVQLWPKVVGHLKNIVKVKDMVLTRTCTEHYDLLTQREYNTPIFLSDLGMTKLRPVHTGNWIAIRSQSNRNAVHTCNLIAIGSQSDRNPSDPHREVDSIAIGRIQLEIVGVTFMYAMRVVGTSSTPHSSLFSLTLRRCINAFYKQRNHTYTSVISHVIAK